MGWKKVASYVARETPEYVFELDEYRTDAGDQMLFVHLWVKKWAPGIFKRIKHEFGLFRQAVKCPLYAIPRVEDDKWVKFVAHLGFLPLTQGVCENGDQRQMFWCPPVVENKKENSDAG